MARPAPPTPDERVAVCLAVAETLAYLHELDIAVGGIGAHTVLFGLHPEPAVLFVDCDTARAGRVAVPEPPTHSTARARTCCSGH